MKRLMALCVSLALVASLAVAQESVSFTDARGVTITLPGKARRVVSLSPELTETLFAVGAGDAVVGVTTYCNYPAEASSKAKIGGFSAKTISVETIVSLKPDLVVGGPSAHAQLAAQFERAGLRFAAVDNTGIDSVYAAIGLLGRVAGDEATAEALEASIKARVAAVKAKTASIPVASRPVVFWETWDEPLMSAGPRTFTAQVIELSGGRNCFADASADWPVVSFEALLARDPDWIMAAESHGAALTMERLSKRSGWTSLKAVKAGRVALIDGDVASRAGPRFAEGLEAMAAILYPELF